jgi:hypothetical protein
MNLRFRNLDMTPDAPVQQWPVEGVLAAIERGTLQHWRKLDQAIQEDPWGPVARRVEAALQANRPHGVAELMERSIARARAGAEQAERDQVARQVQHYLARSGLSAREFAERIGTSPSRLSTYRSGKVMPSAGLLMRMQRIAEACDRDGALDQQMAQLPSLPPRPPNRTS